MVQCGVPYTFRPHRREVTTALVALGRAVELARARRHISQEMLEARSGIDQSTISRFERGLAPGLRLDRVAQILAGLDVDVVEIDRRSDRRDRGEGCPRRPVPVAGTAS